MLGLNRRKDIYTITAYHYELLDVEDNIQKWSPTARVFKCAYASNKMLNQKEIDVDKESPSAVITTDSPIRFKINDKISINGITFQVKGISTDFSHMSSQFTNSPRFFTKVLTLS